MLILKNSSGFNIGIIGNPMTLHNKVSEVLIRKFLKIIEPISNNLTIVSGNLPGDLLRNPKFNCYNIFYDNRNNPLLLKIIKYFNMQVELAKGLFKERRNIDVVFFWIGATLIVPMLIAKITRLRTVLFITGIPSINIKDEYPNFSRFALILLSLIEKINCLLAEKIAVEAENIVRYRKLERYRHKIECLSLYVDTDKYTLKVPFTNRGNTIGYIGRLSPEKKPLALLKALPNILEKKSIELIIAGDGPLRREVMTLIEELNIKGNVKNMGWVSYEEVLQLLNKIKLLVLPSDTEGLPNIVLEAMACGTPVLATPVGGIPDIIKDGETGFLLEDNSVRSIEKGIIRALGTPNLPVISERAHNFILENYSYHAAVEKVRRSLLRMFPEGE